MPEIIDVSEDNRSRSPVALPLAFSVAVLLVAGGCSDGTMAPSSSTTCGRDTPVSLRVLQAATFDCSDGGTAAAFVSFDQLMAPVGAMFDQPA